MSKAANPLPENQKVELKKVHFTSFLSSTHTSHCWVLQVQFGFDREEISEHVQQLLS